MATGRRRRLERYWTAIHIAEWCDYRGVTQAELARRTGLSEGLISQLVTKQTNGGPESLEKIADALDIPLGYLFDVVPKKGGRWARFWIPEPHVETVLTVLPSLGAKLGQIEDDE